MTISRSLLPVMAACVLSIASTSAEGPPADPATVNAVESMAADFADHPQSQAEDIYKFLHQALNGPGHAIESLDVAARSLEREIAEMGPLRLPEPFCTVLGGDPILMRVHLRIFVAEERDLNRLLEAFIATAKEYHPDSNRMQAAITLSVEFLQSLGSAAIAGQLEELEKELRPQGYPAIHHSQTYRDAYNPAYRVVKAFYASEHGWCSK